jgi:hypothetical protein
MAPFFVRLVAGLDDANAQHNPTRPPTQEALPQVAEDNVWVRLHQLFERPREIWLYFARRLRNKLIHQTLALHVIDTVVHQAR